VTRHPGAAWILGILLFSLVLGGAACRRTGKAALAASSPPDVVLVTIDTLRADIPGFAGNSRVATPNLDRIAAEGVVFDNAHGQNVVTLPSHVNILTGLYPYQHGVRDNDGFRLGADVPTLATRLKARGYSTAAFIGAFPLDSRYGLARGFDVYDQSFPQGTGSYDLTVPERPASEVVTLSRRWLAARSSAPRFLWVHLYDCHAPYRPPPPFDRTYAAEPYLGEVAAVDEALGSLFDDLRILQRAGHPVFLVVTGDHGEGLGDHGELTHGLFAYEATLRIPLVLWSPGRVAPRREHAIVRHVDIAPTILEAVEAERARELPGRSLLGVPVESAPSSYFEALSCSFNRGWAPLRGVVGGGFKYIDLPIPELYDLEKDPGETNNLFAARGDVARRLASALPPETAAPKPAPPSAEEVSKLRSLGYLAGSAPAKRVYTAADDPKMLVGIDGDLHRIVQLFDENHLSESAALARRIIAERPAMQTGYEFLSLAQEQAGDTRAAIATLEEGRRRGVLSEALQGRLGLLHAEQGEAKRARQILEPLAASSDIEVINALGIARTGDDDLGGALQAFHRALALDPRDATAYQNIGIAQLQFGKNVDALAALDRALALNDRLPRAWNAKGVALERLSRPDEAMAAWQHAADVDPSQMDALLNIGLTAVSRGRTETARRALQKFLAAAPPATYAREREEARRLLAGLPKTPPVR
jgi:arylsulfatase A-like enzyme/tetratricopeptide (TPR) repeat protein